MTHRSVDAHMLTLSDLAELPTLRPVIEDLYNHLAANASSMTQSSTLAQQMIKIFFCKLYDELNAPPTAPLEFSRAAAESPTSLYARLQRYFADNIPTSFPNLFNPTDQIDLDPDNLAYMVDHLQWYRISDPKHHIIGDAFETIIGYALKGSKGQFFTPRNAVKLMVDIIDPKPGERILDPACGSGGFLVHVFHHIRSQSNQHDGTLLFGIDKDEFLAKVANAYLTAVGATRSGVFCDNSLASPGGWSPATQQHAKLGSFDVVLTNPPFGKKLTVKDRATLSQFDLGHKWRKGPKGTVIRTDRTANTATQILFLERCLDFLRDGGRLGIVLPESLLANPSYHYVMHYLDKRVRFLAVVSMPEDLFQPFTHTKTCLALVQKTVQPPDYTFFMGVANWCGHDSRGNPTIRQDPNTGNEQLLDDLPTIATRYAALAREGGQPPQDHLGFQIRHSGVKNSIFVPRYYDPDITKSLEALGQTHDLVTIQSLVDEGVLAVRTGVEVGRLAYGTGPIPFIRTSDIANWELKIDPKHSVSEEIYQQHNHRAQVRSGDILLVRDGTYLVGTSCILSKYDERLLFQSHIYRLRIQKPDYLDPYLLFAALNSPSVKRQIQAKRFTQDIIDTLGSRLYELVLPLPKDDTARRTIAMRTKEIVETRARLREEMNNIPLAVEGRPCDS
jgi:type I restriction enzyme M protein